MRSVSRAALERGVLHPSDNRRLENYAGSVHAREASTASGHELYARHTQQGLPVVSNFKIPWGST
ncbi:MAG TPA: hypothetical protein VFU02_23315 [Polyangiaceae bacterium]|nr:hypothetical protein [Polyangiaceae bacterium]